MLYPVHMQLQLCSIVCGSFLAQVCMFLACLLVALVSAVEAIIATLPLNCIIRQYCPIASQLQSEAMRQVLPLVLIEA